MKILLTGHKGFIGSILAPRLQEKGHKVCIINIDIRDHKRTTRWIRLNRPDCVIHLASINSIMYSFEHPLDVMNVNFISTMNIADACSKLDGFKQFVFASSTEVYGNILKNKKKRIGEESTFSPTNPHAVSKIASEFYIQQLGKHGFPYTILRLSNTYGRKKNSGFFIESLLEHMLTKKNISLGNPKVVRDFLFVEDHIDAYIKVLGNKKAIGQAINICSGEGHSISEIAKKASKLTNFKGNINWHSSPIRPNEAKIFIGDNSKAKKLVGWYPKYSLDDGLIKTLKYLEKSD